MKTLEQYIEDVEVGETVPSISGKIDTIKNPKEGKTIQKVTISDDEDNAIDLWIKEGAHIDSDAEGQVISLTSSKGSSSSKGLTLKETKDEEPYILVDEHASITVGKKNPSKSKEIVEEDSSEDSDEEEKPAKKKQSKEAPKRDSAEKQAVKKYVTDRLAIYSFVKESVTEINELTGIDFPIEKLAELTTSIHIELGRASININGKAWLESYSGND